MLPHEKLRTRLLAPVRARRPGRRTRQPRDTSAKRRNRGERHGASRSQLTAYRDRLADIAKRAKLSVDDIIKIAPSGRGGKTELGRAASWAVTHSPKKRSSASREDVSIQLLERAAPPPGRWSRLLDDVGATLSDSAVSALLFAIGALPWLPIIAVVIWLVSRLWRWLLQRRTIRVAGVNESRAIRLTGDGRSPDNWPQTKRRNGSWRSRARWKR